MQRINQSTMTDRIFAICEDRIAVARAMTLRTLAVCRAVWHRSSSLPGLKRRDHLHASYSGLFGDAGRDLCVVPVVVPVTGVATPTATMFWRQSGGQMRSDQVGFGFGAFRNGWSLGAES